MTRGYRLKETLIEVYGEEQLKINLNGGCFLRTDYGSAWDCLPQSRTAPHKRPYLVGITQEEALSGAGTTMAMLFTAPNPRFGFKEPEQRMLRHALMGATDEEIARALSISFGTVRKRWLAAFARVQKSMPDLFPAGENAAQFHTRGVEKRRHLLNYLRDHWDELRPYDLRL